MNGANQAHMKAMLRAIKYVKQTKDMKLKLKPQKLQDLWNMKAYCDSDFWMIEKVSVVSLSAFAAVPSPGVLKGRKM